MSRSCGLRQGPQLLVVVPTRELGVQAVMLVYKLFGGSVHAGIPGDPTNMFSYRGPAGIRVGLPHPPGLAEARCVCCPRLISGRCTDKASTPPRKTSDAVLQHACGVPGTEMLVSGTRRSAVQHCSPVSYEGLGVQGFGGVSLLGFRVSGQHQEPAWRPRVQVKGCLDKEEVLRAKHNGWLFATSVVVGTPECLAELCTEPCAVRLAACLRAVAVDEIDAYSPVRAPPLVRGGTNGDTGQACETASGVRFAHQLGIFLGAGPAGGHMRQQIIFFLICAQDRMYGLRPASLTLTTSVITRTC